MKTIIHKANSRGHANHGWLDTHHTFSFANYYDPERIHFGALRVLNDDEVAPGKGFGMHPHDNMEIISIPLSGDLEHKDNMGNQAVIQEGDVQVMSAGTGVFHSEYNRNSDKSVKFLQIWVFPDRKNIEPRYDQVSIRDLKTENELFQVLSPDKNDKGVWVYQKAWFSMGHFTAHKTVEYELKDASDGVYVFVLEGNVSIEGNNLSKRDGIGISETEKVKIETESGTSLLVMEVPMQIG
ncbi:pirin family protein [Saccharicrinis sp. FJH62]|uniref:pirin family protein n=1 Tax=Saccharicrinis sp. FJH62 TaxID=3344657 RepID=UPI0035D4FF49